MGCDIHLIAEVRNSYDVQTLGGVEHKSYWERIYPHESEREPYYVEMANDPDWGTAPWNWPARQALLGWYHTRNYRLFSVLAGVRQSIEGDEPIAEPRGYPADLSDEGEHWAHQNDCAGACIDLMNGDHSFSWLTLAELQAHEARLRDADADFADRVLPALAKRGKPEDVRIVFGFDS